MRLLSARLNIKFSASSSSIQFYIRAHPAYSHAKLTTVLHRKLTSPRNSFLSLYVQLSGRSSRQPLLGQPDEKHRRRYEYCVIARLPRNKREPVTMTSLSRHGTSRQRYHRRPTGTMNFKFSAAMQIRKPRERCTYESRWRGGNLPQITTRNDDSDVLIARVNHFRCARRIS